MFVKVVINLCFSFVAMMSFFYASNTLGKDVKLQKIEGGYKVEISQDVRVKVDSPVENFIIYRFYSLNNEKFLTLYIGNHPAIEGSMSELDDCKKVLLLGFSSKCKVSSNKNGELENNVYAKISNSGSPQYAHFSYESEKRKHIKLIESILLSFSEQ